MKAFLALLFACITLTGLCQSQKDLLKKYGIKKVTTLTKEEGAADKTTVTYYDDKGNDTATYTYGSRYQYAVINYDKQNRVIKKETFWDDGKPATVYVYTYAKDGSFTVIDEDAEFKLKSTSWYNAKGQVMKLQSPDGSIRTYTYDAKGNLLKRQTTERNKKPTLLSAKYKFDGKGRVIESLWSDGDKTTYKYDDRGLIAESSVETSGGAELAPYKARILYQYE